MPTPARTSLPEIVGAGRDLLAREGAAGLTMQRVGEAVGVRAPSLYKRVASRAELVRLVAEDVATDLTRQLARAATSGDPRQDLRALALAFRRFARRDPYGFELLFSALPEGSAPDAATFAAAAEPVLRVAEALAGPDRALEAARTITAWATGFLRMELAGDFQFGGSVSEAFEYGVRVLTDGLECGRRG